MDNIMAIYEFLFETRNGMFVLIFGGMAIFAIIAFFMERRTHKQYFNHPKTDDEDDGWGSWLNFDDDDEDEDEDS